MTRDKKAKLVIQGFKVVPCPDCNYGVKAKVNQDGEVEEAICPRCRLLIS